MRIELNSLTSGSESMKQNSRAVSLTADDESLTFEESLHFNDALASTPDVRVEKMARARVLVADPNYPSQEQMKQVASLLAANWGNKKSVVTALPRFTRQPLAPLPLN